MMKQIFLLLIILGAFNLSNASEKERIVILNLKAISVEKELADLVTESLITSFVKSQEYQVVERSQLESVLSELKLTATDDFSDNTALEIGKLSKAKLVIIGTVGKVGASYLINIRSIDVETGNILYADRVIVKSAEELLPATDTLAAKIKSVDEQQIKVEKRDTAKRKNGDDIYIHKEPSSLNNINKIGIGLLASGGVITLTGAAVFIFDNIYYPEVKQNASSYKEYKAAEKEDLIFLVTGLAAIGTGSIAMLSSIPLLLHKENKVSFNVEYGRELTVSLSFKF